MEVTHDEVISYQKRMVSYTMTPLQELVKACKDLKMNRIECTFNGGHDSGSIESIIAYQTDDWITTAELPNGIYTIVEDQFWRVLGEMYGSFAGEFTVDGTITYFPPSDSHPNGLIESEISEYVISDDPESYYDDGE